MVTIRLWTGLCAALSLLLSVQSFCFAQSYSVGSRVDASPSSDKWYPATITGAVQNGYSVRLDANPSAGIGQNEEYVVPAYRVRNLNAAATQNTASASSASILNASANPDANKNYQVGSRIDASPYSDLWHPATVIGMVPNGYKVKLDPGNGFGQNEEYIVPYYRTRNLSLSSPRAVADNSPSSPASAVADAPRMPTFNPAPTDGGLRVHPKNPNIKWTTNYTPPGQTGPINSGKGKPPDGSYNCVMWTAGMMINLGKLEIAGNTYRGLNKNAGFHSYAVDGSGNMTLSAGLSGLPTGFTLKSVGWVGADSRGRPLIKISYIGRQNAHDTIDAIKE